MFAGVDVVWRDNPTVQHINNGTVSFSIFHMPLSIATVHCPEPVLVSVVNVNLRGRIIIR